MGCGALCTPCHSLGFVVSVLTGSNSVLFVQNTHCNMRSLFGHG